MRMLAEVETGLTISSEAFEEGGEIPQRYTCSGKEISPPLHFDGIPVSARTLVLIMEDPDAPGKTFDHWVAFNIAPVDHIEEDTIPGTVARNSRGENKYHGPCPPDGTHRYFFKLFALDSLLYLTESATKDEIMTAMESHVISFGETMATYRKVG